VRAPILGLVSAVPQHGGAERAAAADGGPADLDWLLELQSGVASTAQLRARGITRGRTRAQAAAGRWQLPYPRVVFVHGRVVPYVARVWGAVLWAGQGAAASHQTAGYLMGLVATEPADVHISIPEIRRLAPPAGVILHRASSPAIDTLQALPQTTVERTTLDLASSSLTVDGVVTALSDAIQMRLTTATRLLAALDQLPKMRWRNTVRRLLGPELDGVRSPLEWRYATDVERAHGLPRGIRQQRSTRSDGATTVRDVAYEEYGLVVELDGRLGHSGVCALRDMARDNRKTEAGEMTLRYGWVDVTTRPCLAARQVGHVLGLRGWQGSVRSCGSGCSAGARR
jgi:hypothetical protein